MSDYPPSWRVLPLGEVAEVVGGGTPSRDVPAFWGNDHHWITPSEVVAKDGQTADHSKEQISILGLQNSGAKLHPPGTILMTSRASIGFAAIATEEICTNQGFQSLRCRNELDNWFALHQIRHRRAELQQLAAGSTFLEVSGSNVRSFPFIVPPLPEQKKIAEILSGIDTAIMLLDAKISKLNLAKSSVSEKEFAHASFLQAEASGSENLLQKKTLREVADVIDCKHRTPAYTSEGFPVVRPRDVKESGINFDQCIKTSAEELDSLNDGINPQINDIVYSRNATLGVGALIRNKITFAIGQDVCILRSKAINPKYFYYQLNSASFFRQVENLVSGSTFKRINLGSIRELQVITPDTFEQARVASTLESIDNSIASLQRRREKNTQLKTSLATDLLSGRKRVSV